MDSEYTIVTKITQILVQTQKTKSNLGVIDRMYMRNAHVLE